MSCCTQGQGAQLCHAAPSDRHQSRPHGDRTHSRVTLHPVTDTRADLTETGRTAMSCCTQGQGAQLCHAAPSDRHQSRPHGDRTHSRVTLHPAPSDRHQSRPHGDRTHSRVTLHPAPSDRHQSRPHGDRTHSRVTLHPVTDTRADLTETGRTVVSRCKRWTQSRFNNYRQQSAGARLWLELNTHGRSQ
ncbi:hypothetical protein NDU88_000859 [Pleurodeles waltl]|uniref:Uncharacterized protein n=1 Tax=Pleurodeles waltl TaxID=8319 RepID=A0AAV7U6R9_PLEWA|nr:hypothetical protein NDU88_000859 [Pleurodeles waltl]